MPQLKTVLLTGASSGIGRALAIRAARAGYAVYGVGRNHEALDTLRVKIEAEGGLIAIDAIDVAVAGNARGLIERALARFGSIDVLVNNAGFVSAGPLCAQDDAQLQRQFGTHVIGPVALVREALPALRRVRGHVFMLGSGVARVPVGGLGAYPPAKAAIRSATAILRRELRPDGIAVTYVDPGAVDTPFMKRAGMPGAPANVLVSPEAVARKILIAIGSRPRELNAVGWQTAAVGLAALFPRLTDALLERAPALVGGGAEPRETTALAAAHEPQAPNEPTALPKPAAEVVTPPEPVVEIEAPPAPVADIEAPPAAVAEIEAPPEPVAEIEAPPLPDAEDSAPPEAAAEAAVSTGLFAPEPVVDISAPSERVAAGATSAEPDGVAPPERRFEDVSMSPFEAALEPHQRRMQKLNLRSSFVRDLLVPDATLDPGDVALRWAGMPNKHERAITEDVLAALADAGFLERADGSAYRVVRAP